MKKLPAFVVLIIALALGSAAPRSQSRVALEQALLDRTVGGEEIRVIVGVGVGFMPEGDLAGPMPSARNVRTSRPKPSTTPWRAPRPLACRWTGSSTAIPYFTASVNRAQLEALATTAGVTSIGEDVLLQPTLGDTAPMVNAPAAWAAGHTGAGWRSPCSTPASKRPCVPWRQGHQGGVLLNHNRRHGAQSGDHFAVPGRGQLGTSGPAAACGGNRLRSRHARRGYRSRRQRTGRAQRRGAGRLHSCRFRCSPASTRPPSAMPVRAPRRLDSDIINGLERVLALRHEGRQPIAAVNMSLGEGLFSAANCDAVQADGDQGRYRQPPVGRRCHGHRIG